MSPSKQSGGASSGVSASSGSPPVERSDVPAGLEYGEYRPHLRHDFFHSCAYCTMSEAEAQAIRFVIDHYEPRNARPELVHEYLNLMYSCDECNLRKGDRCPPPNARADGYRFYRPDQDMHQDHFQQNGIRLESKSNTGTYSIDALDLNRQSLRRLRNIRDRLTKCNQFVAQGVLGLRSFHIDQLPPSIKGTAARAIHQAEVFADQIENDIDALLQDHAKSALIDDDEGVEIRAKERAALLKELQVLFPGTWRAPRKSRHSGT